MAEIDQLPTFDGFVFVIDSRLCRIEAGANREAYTLLERDLASRGRALADVPIVFQANYRDWGDVCTMDWVRESFTSPRCAYAESVASSGIGVMASLRLLVELVVDAR